MEKVISEKEIEVLNALKEELPLFYDEVLGNFASSVDLTCMKKKNAKIIKEWLEHETKKI